MLGIGLGLGFVRRRGGAAGPGPTWGTAFSTTLDMDEGGWTGYTGVTILDAVVVTRSGSKVRVTFTAAMTHDSVLAKAFLGHAAASGDAYDFDGGQVQLLFSGSPGVTVPMATSVVSDEATFALDETKNVIIAAFLSSDFLRFAAGVTGASSYYKLGDDAATTNKSGYTIAPHAGATYIPKIETFA